MKPIDHFEDHVNSGWCPWNGLELTQTTLKEGYVCSFNYAAGARGDEPCSAEDWKRCPLLAHQMVPSFRAAVKEGEKQIA